MTNDLNAYGVNLWNNNDSGLIDIYSNGLPFLINRGEAEWSGLKYDEAGTAVIQGGWKGKYLCLLGNISTYDKGTGSWFSKRGDMSKEQFIGDRIGTIEIVYEDESTTTIPLIFGFTIWWDEPLMPATGHGPYHEPFASDARSREILEDSLYLNKFRSIKESAIYEPGLSYYSIFPLYVKTVRQINFKRNLSFFGEPLYVGMTLLSDQPAENLYLFPEPMRAVDLGCSKIVTNPVLEKSFYEPRIRLLQKILYTFKEDCHQNFSIERPASFEGPVIEFKGGRYAEMLTNIYYNNLDDLLQKTDPVNHMAATSTPKAPAWGEYTSSIGTWKNDLGRGNNANYAGIWSRDGAKVGIERRRFGLGYLNPNEIRSFDRCLYNALPPHWTRDISNLFNMHSKYDKMTINGKRVIGAPENDGHGAVMMLRYTDWLYSADKEQWILDYWQATADSCNWVCWLMDNKLSADQPDDVIWSVTEPSGYNGAEIYSNSSCLLGLMAGAIIAAAHNKTEQADQWGMYISRLTQGIMEHLVADKSGKEIWKAHENSSWQDLDESLAPVFQAADLFGYLPDQHLFNRKWNEISLNTYMDRILSEPRYLHGRAFGYGFGYIAQTALLLDRAKDADELIQRICDQVYFNGPFPWIVPEGVVVHPSGDYWFRSGDHGNLAQQVEIIKMIRIMIGLDDSDLNHLKVLPRIPGCIQGVEVSRFKVRDASGNLVDVGYSLNSKNNMTKFSGDFRLYKGNVTIRLGAVTAGNAVSVNVPDPKITDIGDGWIQVEFLPSDDVIEIEISGS